MLKRQELSDPNSCLNTAKDDDWVFVLKEKDSTMPATIYFWASERIRCGLNRRDDRKISSALDEANTIIYGHCSTREMAEGKVRELCERFSL